MQSVKASLTRNENYYGYHPYIITCLQEVRVLSKNKNNSLRFYLKVKLGKSFQPFPSLPSNPFPRIDSSTDFPSSQVCPEGCRVQLFPSLFCGRDSNLDPPMHPSTGDLWLNNYGYELTVQCRLLPSW
ncbi:hypothetical protein TNIN_169831 [Trichonephila inaurata madagascariensis]|uniref:Uncharacterized protein n=1 Tax=Trichonephila inaurata madagascariensis TaxID=2747483 RepID=A0A8X6YU05_9ARAC|nr:hypothetical protein TNIN_169831 [Trichonephila inaurata madagascariensis]